jgi:hypothetical protein
MASNLRNRILAANDIKVEKIAVPEWGGDYFIRVISGSDRDAFEDSYADKKMKSFRVRFLVLALCDKDGERIFSNDDVSELSKKSAIVINRVFEAAWKSNAFTQEAVDALGEDSPADQTDASSLS